MTRRQGLILTAQSVVFIVAVAIAAATSSKGGADWQPIELVGLLLLSRRRQRPAGPVEIPQHVDLRFIRGGLSSRWPCSAPPRRPSIGVGRHLPSTNSSASPRESDHAGPQRGDVRGLPEVVGGNPRRHVRRVRWTSTEPDALSFAGDRPRRLHGDQLPELRDDRRVVQGAPPRTWRVLSPAWGKNVWLTVLPAEFATGLLTAGVAYRLWRASALAPSDCWPSSSSSSRICCAPPWQAFERGQELAQRTKELAAPAGLVSLTP